MYSECLANSFIERLNREFFRLRNIPIEEASFAITLLYVRFFFLKGFKILLNLYLKTQEILIKFVINKDILNVV